MPQTDHTRSRPFEGAWKGRAICESIPRREVACQLPSRLLKGLRVCRTHLQQAVEGLLVTGVQQGLLIEEFKVAFAQDGGGEFDVVRTDGDGTGAFGPDQQRIRVVDAHLRAE